MNLNQLIYLNNMGNEIEYELRFSDKTLLESKGIFKDTQEIMSREPFAGEWMLSSNLEMVVSMGDRIFEAYLVLNFYHDGVVYITEYNPSSGDVYSNPDIRGLSAWIGESGWKSLRPSNDLVRGNLDFWKYFWETNLIDSDYLDKNYGLRDIMEMEDQDEDNELEQDDDQGF